MKTLILGLFLILFASGTIYAAPASPDLLDLAQPDGSSFKARKHGDEFQGWTATESGHTIIKNKKTNVWEYATQGADGTLQPSGQKVVPTEQAPAGIPKGLKPPRNVEAEAAHSQTLKEIYQDRLKGAQSQSSKLQSGEAFAAGDWVPTPVSGTRNILVILVNFSDRTLVTTASGWSDSIFSTSAGVKSVSNYYKDTSFNTLSISPVSHTQVGNPAGVVTVSIALNHPDTPVTGATEATWVAAAIDAAAAYVDFAALDANGNGYIDRTEAVVYLIPAGYEESGSAKTPSVWAHATRYSSGGLSAAGKLFPAYAMNGELNNVDVQHPMGVIAHEMGHQFCGLPDLYDTSSQNQGMGNFSLMASGSWGRDTGENGGTTPTNLDAWSREYLGWATPVTPVASGALSLAHPLSSQSAAYKLILPLLSTTEYFLIENRQPTGWDTGLRGFTNFGSGWTGGLLITHIDITAGTQGSNDINKYTANAGRQGVIPVQASTAACEMLTVGASCRGHATTLYYSGNNAAWSDSTTPNSKYYSGAATNFGLTGISAPAATMTGTLSLSPPVMKTLTVSKTGSGTVTSSPAGISCGATCSAQFPASGVVTLSASAAAGSVFTGWSGGGCSGTGSCNVTLTDNTTVSATFAVASTTFTQTFDTATVPGLPAGWTTAQIVTGGSYEDGAWNTKVGTNYPSGIAAHSGANLVYFNSYDASVGNSTDLISPAFSLTGVTNRTVKFWMYRDTEMGDKADRVEVYVNTAASSSGATLLGTVNRQTGLAPAVAAAGWYEHAFAIPDSFNTATNYLIFRGISAWGNDVHIDDISVLGVPSCSAPAAPLMNYPKDYVPSGSPYTIAWGSVAGATSYDVCEADNASFVGQTCTNVAGTSRGFSHAVGSVTNYYYRARAVNACGSSSYSSNSTNIVVYLYVPSQADAYAELICPASVAVGAALNVGVKIHNKTCDMPLTFTKTNALLVGNANGTLSGVGIYGPKRSTVSWTAPAAVCPAEGISGQSTVNVVTAVNASLAGKAAQVMIEAISADGQVVASGECMVPVQ